MSKVRIVEFKGTVKIGVSVVEKANEWLDKNPECELIKLIPVHDVIPPSHIVETLYIVVKEENNNDINE